MNLLIREVAAKPTSVLPVAGFIRSRTHYAPCKHGDETSTGHILIIFGGPKGSTELYT